ncbi:FtsX-like permease family protein [Aerophototrophica crusticola]|uniref:FtsX-like permease family protein n=1 Tax=Aerophototrophica crusticola TaxID=1709002 RepID=A0A858R8X5_9PROT|nr:FtsX-like permease family protein [Rhodospirillaceae bacterium B3]
MVHLLRLFRRQTLFTLINLVGLAVGIAGFLGVSLYVQGEYAVDRSFTAADRLYRVANTITLPGRGPMVTTMSAPEMLGPLLGRFPEVEAATRVRRQQVGLDQDGRVFEAALLWADANLFSVLDFPLRSGDPATALARPDGLVLSPTLARTLFGDLDPVGRTVSVKGGPVLTVTGVLAPVPESHLDFAAIAAEAALGPRSWSNWASESWSQGGASTYVRLRQGADPGRLRDGLTAFVEQFATGLPPKEWAPDFLRLRLDAVTDIHLKVKAVDDAKPGGDVGTLRLLVGVALLILGVAVVNYTNLATAQAIQRAKEVGIRKLAGARRRQLVLLFTGESVALALAGTILALGLVELLLPAFEGLVGRQLSAASLYAGPLLAVSLAAPLVVGVLGGLYPALVLSGYRPAEVLKGRAGPPGSGRLRSALVVGQFAISIALVVATLTVQGQVDHARGADLGFRQENLYVVGSLPDGPEGTAQTLKAEAARIPGVLSATLTSIVPANPSETISTVLVEGRRNDEPALMSTFTADRDFLATYDIPVTAGPGLPGQAPDWRYGLVSEAGARRLGFANPAEAVGTRYFFREEDSGNPTEIVGVIPDIRLRNAREGAEAMLFTIGPAADFLTVRLAPGDPRPAVEALSALVDRLFPGLERIWQGFLDDRIDSLYRNEERQARVFAVFAALAILLANLGLFGLTALAAARRTKEIGIRRVVGAGVGDVLRLLAWQFTRPVLLANLVAWPVAWWLLSGWLEQFTVRITLGPEPFIAAGTAALVVALATVSLHALRVALAPPARALRYE